MIHSTVALPSYALLWSSTVTVVNVNILASLLYWLHALVTSLVSFTIIFGPPLPHSSSLGFRSSWSTYPIYFICWTLRQ